MKEKCTSRYRKVLEELRERINNQEGTILAKNEELGCLTQHVVELRGQNEVMKKIIGEQANENLFLHGQSGALQSELDALRVRNCTQASTIREKQSVIETLRNDEGLLTLQWRQKVATLQSQNRSLRDLLDRLEAQVLTLTNLLDDARGNLKNLVTPEPAPAAPQMTSTAEDYITADGVVVLNINGTLFALWPDGTLRQEFTEKYQTSVWRTVHDCPSRAVYSAFSGFKAWANFKGEVLNYGV